MNSSASNPARIPIWQFIPRLAWVVVQFMLVYWLGHSGAQFFYQGF